MTFLKLLLVPLLGLIQLSSNAQEFKWAKDAEGKLYPMNKIPYPGFRSKEVFELFHHIPAISHPKGFDVRESWTAHTKLVPKSAILIFAIHHYFTYKNGPIKKNNNQPPQIEVSINNPEDLVDRHSSIFIDETEALGMPIMYTDTFPTSYQDINGYGARYFINNNYSSNLKSYLLNPMNLRIFKAVTREEYLKVFINHLDIEIKQQTEANAETKKTITSFEKNDQLRNSLDDLRQVNESMIKWVDFLKSKRSYYQKKLISLSQEERKKPATWAMYNNPANTKDKKGNYLETISGSLPYEPMESTEGILASGHLYSFYEKIFDNRLPGTAFQLIIISEPYWQGPLKGIQKEMREFFEENVYPFFPFKEMEAIMGK